MKKYCFTLLIVVLSAFILLAAAPVSAQEIDLDSMTNAELLLLLQSIMDKMEQGEPSPETAEPSSPEPTPGPVAEDPAETEPEIRLFQVYDNKKLIIEALPSYMFIQPTQEVSEPEKNEPDTNEKNNDGKDDKDDNDDFCPPITPCMPGSDDYCEQWVTPEGKCVCMC